MGAVLPSRTVCPGGGTHSVLWMELLSTETGVLQVFIFLDDDMFLGLVLQHWLLFVIQEIVDGVGVEVDP